MLAIEQRMCLYVMGLWCQWELNTFQYLLVSSWRLNLYWAGKERKEGRLGIPPLAAFLQMVINSNSDTIKPEQNSSAGGHINGESWHWKNVNYNRQLLCATKKDDVFLLTLLPSRPEGWSDGSAFAQGKLKALWVFYLATPL